MYPAHSVCLLLCKSSQQIEIRSEQNDRVGGHDQTADATGDENRQQARGPTRPGPGRGADNRRPRAAGPAAGPRSAGRRQSANATAAAAPARRRQGPAGRGEWRRPTAGRPRSCSVAGSFRGQRDGLVHRQAVLHQQLSSSTNTAVRESPCIFRIQGTQPKLTAARRPSTTAARRPTGTTSQSPAR